VSASEQKQNWGTTPEVSTSGHQEEEGSDEMPDWVDALGMQISSFYEPTSRMGFCSKDCVYKDTGGFTYGTVTTTNGVEWVVALYRKIEKGPFVPFAVYPVDNVMCAVAGNTTEISRRDLNIAEIFGSWAMRRGWYSPCPSKIPAEDLFDSFENGEIGYTRLCRRPIVLWQKTVAEWKLKTKSSWSHHELVNDGQVIRDHCMEPMDAFAIVYQVYHE